MQCECNAVSGLKYNFSSYITNNYCVKKQLKISENAEEIVKQSSFFPAPERG